MKTTRQLYGQHLLSRQTNYTCTNLAEHVEGLEHNSVYRYLKGEKLGSALVWEKMQTVYEPSPPGYLMFDDTVLEKPYSSEIQGVRSQYSGCVHRIIKGIGVVNPVYYNPDVDKYWVLDFRIFDPERDGKSKLNHVDDMLDSVRHRKILYQTALMDSWYATNGIMTRLIREKKRFFCPLKKNRLVQETHESGPISDWSPFLGAPLISGRGSRFIFTNSLEERS